MTTEIKEETETIVRVGHWDYKPKVLNELIAQTALNWATKRLMKYADERWHYDKEIQDYHPASTRDEFELTLFETLFLKFRAIVASDRGVVIDSIQNLVDLVENDPAGFGLLYQAAIKANPNFADIEALG